MFIGLQTFSFSPGNIERTNASYILPHNPGAMTLQNFLSLTPKKYQKLTGKNMTLKQKIAFLIIKWKLIKQLSDNKTAKKNNKGILSLIFGISSVLFLILGLSVSGGLEVLGFLALLWFSSALLALIFGWIGLRKNKKDIAALIGLILGGTTLLLIWIGPALSK